MRVESAPTRIGIAPQGAAGAARPGGDEDKRLREACQQFEAVLLAQLLQKMRDTVPEDPLLGDSRAKDVYYGMLDWELAQQMARTQGVGLADALYRQLSHLGASEDRAANGRSDRSGEGASAPAVER